MNSNNNNDNHNKAEREFAERVRINQRSLRANLKSQFDFIVCGSGSSGSVVARRLAENPDVSVLLVEAGGDDDAATVTDARRWVENLGTERDWNFAAQPNQHLRGRAIALNMGKVLGGGSSINGLAWARGHGHDWEFFASETGDANWNYASIFDIYRRIEDWHGVADPERRGSGGLVFVQPAPDPNPIAPAMVESARIAGLPAFDSNNGVMMEGGGGVSILDVRVRDGKRLSVFRTYAFPYMHRPNLTVLTHALVTRLVLDKQRVTGVEIVRDGHVLVAGARLEVVLSLGAIHTPKVLMVSGIGDETECDVSGST